MPLWGLCLAVLIGSILLNISRWGDVETGERSSLFASMFVESLDRISRARAGACKQREKVGVDDDSEVRNVRESMSERTAPTSAFHPQDLFSPQNVRPHS